MDDFIRQRGLPFLAHLLRRVSDEFVRGFAEWNRERGIVAPPRTHSTMQVIAERGPMGVTEVAALIRQSHPLVINWVRQLKELGLIAVATDPNDRRRTVLDLTDAGREDVRRQHDGYAVIERTFAQLMAETGGDVFGQLWRIEQACRERSFLERLRDETHRSSSICDQGSPRKG